MCLKVRFFALLKQYLRLYLVRRLQVQLRIGTAGRPDSLRSMPLSKA